MQNNTDYKTQESRDRESQHFPLAHRFPCPQERSNNHNNQEAVKKKPRCFRSYYFKTRGIIILMAGMDQI